MYSAKMIEIVFFKAQKEIDMDKTVEEFSKVVEEEEKEMQESPAIRKTRKGRPIVAPNRTMDMPETQSYANQHNSTPTKPPSTFVTEKVAVSPVTDQNAMISGTYI